jgi:hypothetical protein
MKAKSAARKKRFGGGGRVGGILVTDALGCDVVMEATEGGFQVRRLDVFSSGTTIVRILTPSAPLLLGVQEATRWLGESGTITSGSRGPS